MSFPPKVSVIFATYNEHPKHLMIALESIVNQTIKPYELIITVEPNELNVQLLKNFKSRLKTRLIFNKSMRGLTSSLNIACKSAKGDFIARMDSDDIWHEDKLEKQLSLLTKNNYDVVGCDINLINTKGELVGDRVYSIRTAKSNFLFQNGLCHPSIIIKTSILRAFGFYNSDFKSAEDLELWLRLLSKKVKIGYYPEKLMKYRIRDNQIRNIINWKFNLKARVKYNFKIYNPLAALISLLVPIGALIMVELKAEVLSQKIYNRLLIKKE